jgi:hypothetical protein
LRQTVGQRVTAQAAQLRRADFQADQEQQQDDAEFRDLAQIGQNLVGNIAKLTDDQPRNQKSDDRAEPPEGEEANREDPEQSDHCGKQGRDIEMGQSTAPEIAGPCTARTPGLASADR